jgi:hypothetical protein
MNPNNQNYHNMDPNNVDNGDYSNNPNPLPNYTNQEGNQQGGYGGYQGQNGNYPGQDGGYQNDQQYGAQGPGPGLGQQARQNVQSIFFQNKN